MHDTDLFQAALGLQTPWRVVSASFDQAAGRLDLRLDFPRGSTFACPNCGAAGCKVHDTVEKEWRHMNFFQHQAYLIARVPRITCAACGVRQVALSWARPGSGFTLLFEAYIMALVKAMPARAVAALIGEHDTRIWRVLQHYVERARDRLNMSGVTRIGLDETASQCGQNYITSFVDLDQRRVLYATPGRSGATVGDFVADLMAHGGSADQIVTVSQDMSAAFQSGVRQHLPNATITFDKFHVVKLIGDAVDEVRRLETKARPELKGSRYAWLKNRTNLTVRQEATLEGLNLTKLNLKTARAYRIRLAFQEVYAQPDRAAGAAMLKKWYFWATHSRLPPIIDAARSIKRHWDGILAWFDSRVTNGILEGINSLIQAAKAKARGYRSDRNLIAITYLIAGKLDLAPHIENHPATHSI